VGNWTLLTNHARVLLAIVGDPGIRLREIAATLGITERTARAIATDLAGAGYVIRHKDSRRNRYQIQAHRLLPGPASQQRAIGGLLDRDRDACPARHAHGRLPRRGWQLPRRGRPAGVDPDSVEVTVEHSTLTIRAERTPHYGDSEQVIVAERPQGSFTRQLSLGEGVDSENLTVAYADGVMHLTIPVSPRTQGRRVEITHAPGGSRTISGSIVEPGEAPAGSTGGGAA
jgi:hypothetical protein